jgi:hypothetical protein
MSNDPDGANALDTTDDDGIVARLLQGATDDAPPADTDANPASEEDEPAGQEAEADAQDDTEDGQPEEEPSLEIDLPDGRKKLTAAEIRDGLMLKADYTRKTMAAAEERKAAEAEKAEAARIKDQLAEALQTWAVPTEVEPDWDALAAKDPVAAFREKAKWDKRQAKAREAADAYRMLQEHERAKAVQTEYAKLVDAVPEWRDPEALKRAFEGMTEAAKGYGFAPDDILGITDHRILRVLKDVAAYQKLQAAKPAVEKKVAAAPPKTLGPGAKPTKPDAGESFRKARADLKRTGSDDAAVRFLMTR